MEREGLEKQLDLGGSGPKGCNLSILCSYHRVVDIGEDVKKNVST